MADSVDVNGNLVRDLGSGARAPASAIASVSVAPIGQGRVVNKQFTVTTSAQNVGIPPGTWRYVEWTILTASVRVSIAVNETAALGSGAIADATTSTWKAGKSQTGVIGSITPSTPLVGGTDVLSAIGSAGTDVEMVLYKDAP